MRNVARLKMGYYPLPEAEGVKLPSLLSFAGPASVIDPCVGQGTALHLVTSDAEVRRYGVELDAERARIAAYSFSLIVMLCLGTGPTVLTILAPAKYVVYTAPFDPNSTRFEKFTGPLPEILSDRIGWPQMVQGFAARYNALPPDVRSRTAIFCSNYGEASAVNILGPSFGLPPAISGHQNYFYWGWNNDTGESVLTLGNDPKEYSGDFAAVEDLGSFDAPWIMDHEHQHYYWLRHRKRTYAEDWPRLRYWY